MIACREYLLGDIDDEGGSYTEEQAKVRCNACAEAIVECAPRRRCLGGYCYPNEEGKLTHCTSSEGAYCLDAIDKPEWSTCPVR